MQITSVLEELIIGALTCDSCAMDHAQKIGRVTIASSEKNPILGSTKQ